MKRLNPYADRSGRPQRVYIAGPYSSDDDYQREVNVTSAERVSIAVMKLGHYVFCPHTMTNYWEEDYDYEAFMELDKTFVRHWATCLLVIGQSPGTAREVEYALKLNIPVYHDIDQLPNLRK